MPSYIQIGGDPTRWFAPQSINPSQLEAGQPLSILVAAPIAGYMLLSPKSASVAVSDAGSAAPPPPFDEPEATIYLPTSTGPSSGHLGYVLPPTTDVQNLENQVMAAMRNGHSQTIPLYGGGTLVLNGATVSFVVVKGGASGESSPHG